jgi:ankyrin repeat protein
MKGGIDHSIPLDLGENTYFLSPSLEVMRKVCRQFGGLVPALGAIRNGDFEAVAFIAKAGADLTGKAATKFDQQLFEAGLESGAMACIDLIDVLQNPLGQTSSEEDDENP